MSNYTTNARTWAVSALALAGAAFMASCGGGGSGGGGTPGPTPTAKATTIDVTSVTTGIPEISALIPICSNASQKTAVQGTSALAKVALLSRATELNQVRSVAQVTASRKASGSTKPADRLGDCGGRMTYPQYSHVSGVTTATLAFENYCTSDSTGERQLVNGSIDYVNTGTPGASGPITTKVTANSPAGVSFITQDSTSKVLSSQVFAFTNFNYTVGVPGGKPTQAQPSSYGIDELTITDKLTGKTYRESGYSVVYFGTPSGGQQYTMSGRGYRSNGDYFDVSTTVPMISDSSGNTVSGAFAFTGANGSSAVATMVPGKVTQATIAVNGTAVTGLPACK